MLAFNKSGDGGRVEIFWVAGQEILDREVFEFFMLGTEDPGKFDLFDTGIVKTLEECFEIGLRKVGGNNSGGDTQLIDFSF